MNHKLKFSFDKNILLQNGQVIYLTKLENIKINKFKINCDLKKKTTKY